MRVWSNDLMNFRNKLQKTPIFWYFVQAFWESQIDPFKGKRRPNSRSKSHPDQKFVGDPKPEFWYIVWFFKLKQFCPFEGIKSVFVGSKWVWTKNPIEFLELSIQKIPIQIEYFIQLFQPSRTGSFVGVKFGFKSDAIFNISDPKNLVSIRVDFAITSQFCIIVFSKLGVRKVLDHRFDAIFEISNTKNLISIFFFF